MRRAWPLVLGLVVAAGCVASREVSKGGACERASECAAALVCIDRICTDDLSKLDAGYVPAFGDTGLIDAAAEVAADVPIVDPDAPPPPDTGTPPPDTSMPPVDTGTPPPKDTGTPPPPDTFVPDTFVPDTFVPDTFVPPADTGGAGD